MKKTIYITAIMLIGMAGLSSCNNPSELPPLDTNYDNSFVLPEPTDLSIEERAYVDGLREEYRQAIEKLQ